MTDEILFRQYIAGNDDAFTTLFKRYEKKLISHLRKTKGCRHNVCEEIVQQAFIKICRARDSFDEGRKFEPWLYTIVDNTWRDSCKMFTRRLKHEKNFSDLDLPLRVMIEDDCSILLKDRHGTPEEHYQIKHDGAMAMGYFNELEPRLKTSIAAMTLMGQSSRAASENLGVSYVQVLNRHRSGLQALRTQMSRAA